MMKTSAWRFLSARCCFPIAAALLAVAVPLAQAQTKPAAPAPRPVPAQWQQMRAQWRDVGQKLIDMAEDFPEDKYDFKAQKDERTFAENLIHVATEDYLMLDVIHGGKLGPALPARGDLPRSSYKTKADVVRLMKQAVADGDKLLESQGDAGLRHSVKFPYGNRMVDAWFCWVAAIEHSGEHYGQLVVYYRVNGMVPPASRPRPRRPSSN